MSALVHRLKADPIELSDSDSDRLLIEEPTCDGDDGKWVRRSSRPRRSSSRFYDFFTGEEDPSTSKAAPKSVKNRPDDAKKSWSDDGSSKPRRPQKPAIGSENKPELIEPQLLLELFERTNKMVIPGQYAVKLPAGPNEFVSVDGAEYLRGLGYYVSLVEEEDVEETKPILAEQTPQNVVGKRKIKAEADDDQDPLRKRIEFESQRVSMSKSPTDSSRPVNSYRIKEVVEPDEFSSASAYSSDEDRGSDGSALEIDVTGGSPPPPETPRLPSVPHSPLTIASVGSLANSSEGGSRRPKSKPKRGTDPPVERKQHNEMERMRRKDLASKFVFLKDCLLYCSPLKGELNERTPKIKILKEAEKMIIDLRRIGSVYETELKQLTDRNGELRSRYDELCREIPTLPQAKKPLPTKVKKVAGSKK